MFHTIAVGLSAHFTSVVYGINQFYPLYFRINIYFVRLFTVPTHEWEMEEKTTHNVIHFYDFHLYIKLSQLKLLKPWNPTASVQCDLRVDVVVIDDNRESSQSGRKRDLRRLFLKAGPDRLDKKPLVKRFLKYVVTCRAMRRERKLWYLFMGSYPQYVKTKVTDKINVLPVCVSCFTVCFVWRRTFFLELKGGYMALFDSHSFTWSLRGGHTFHLLEVIHVK